jgi:hypothetical protein
MRDFHGVCIPEPTVPAPLRTPDGDAIDEITESLASAGLL